MFKITAKSEDETDVIGETIIAGVDGRFVESGIAVIFVGVEWWW